MTKKKPRYESRVFDGRIIHSAEIERIHREVLDFKHIEAISEPMRELIEERCATNFSCRPRRRDEDFKLARPLGAANCSGSRSGTQRIGC
jgi:hypothetical protein